MTTIPFRVLSEKERELIRKTREELLEERGYHNLKRGQEWEILKQNPEMQKELDKRTRDRMESKYPEFSPKNNPSF